MTTIARSALDFFIVFFVTLCVLGIFVSDVFIFRSKPATYNDDNIANLEKLTTKDGTKISAIYYDNPKAKYTILVSHGNAEDIGTSQDFAKMLVKQGFSALVYDYYGYGTSEGKPSESNSYLAVKAAYNFLVKDKKVPSRSIIAYGHSLGSALATYIASNEPIGGLILEGAFTSTFRVVTIVRILPFDKFNTIGRIGDITIPKLFIHGTADVVVPFWHGEKLFESAVTPKDNLWVVDASHTNVKFVAPTEYWQKWHKLVKEMESFQY